MTVADRASPGGAFSDRRAGQVSGAPGGFEHRKALDGLRVVAAGTVLAANVGGATGFAFTGAPASWVVARGDVGVAIFFALSGFLLYRPWASAALGGDENPPIGTYVRRRVLRIIPAYWIVVVIAMITLNQAHARSPWPWLQYLFLVQTYDAHPWWTGTGAAGLGQMWSLAADASFYLVLPVLAALLTTVARRGDPAPALRARRMLVGIAVLGISSYGFLVLAYRPTAAMPWLGVTLPALMTWFAVGMALAVVSAWAEAEPGSDRPVMTFCRSIGSSAAPCLLIAVLVFVLACTPVAGPEAFGIPSLWQAEIKTGLYTVIAAAVVAPAAFQPPSRTRVTALLSGGPMRGGARISYGVFLWQALVIAALLKIRHVRIALADSRLNTLGTVAMFAAVAVITCAIAVACYYLIERPALRLSHRPPRHRGDASPSPAGQPRTPFLA